jgi:hypothetical protein
MKKFKGNVQGFCCQREVCRWFRTFVALVRGSRCGGESVLHPVKVFLVILFIIN